MSKITDGNVSIEVQRENNEFTVNLEAVQYRLESISQYELFIEDISVLLPGKIVEASDELLKITYKLPALATSVTEVIKKAELFERVEIARKFSILKQDGTDIAKFFIHPENLFLASKQLYVAHRGFTGSIEPKVSSFEQFLEQYKALVVSTLNPRYKYEAIVTGKVKVRDKALTKVLSAKTTIEVEQMLDEQYHELCTTREQTEFSVKKSRYSMFKFLTIVFAVLLVGVGIWLGLLFESTVPRQNRIINAKAAYMVNDFNEATSILSDDVPRTLPPAVQYMLATSYVQLGTLNAQQRQAVINNLSPSTSEIELIYWIYIGRGRLVEALDIAYSLGDTHLKINAYAYRYDYIYADMNMPGAQKQEYLNRYHQRLEELNAVLDGDDDDDDDDDDLDEWPNDGNESDEFEEYSDDYENEYGGYEENGED